MASESYNTGQNNTTIVCELCSCNQREQVMGPTSSISDKITIRLFLP